MLLDAIGVLVARSAGKSISTINVVISSITGAVITLSETCYLSAGPGRGNRAAGTDHRKLPQSGYEVPGTYAMEQNSVFLRELRPHKKDFHFCRSNKGRRK